MSKRSKFICLKQIADMCSCSAMSARRYSKLPGFPDPYLFNGKPLWKEVDVERWIESCRQPRKIARV